MQDIVKQYGIIIIALNGFLRKPIVHLLMEDNLWKLFSPWKYDRQSASPTNPAIVEAGGGVAGSITQNMTITFRLGDLPCWNVNLEGLRQ